MAFRVYAPGTQVLSPGSFGPMTLDPTNVVAGCGGSVVNDPSFGWIVDLPAGTYTVTVHVEFTGAAVTGNQIDTTAATYDLSELYNNGGDSVRVGPGNPLDEVLGPFTLSEQGLVSVFAGPGTGISGLTITAASYIEITCESAGGLRVGPLRMKPGALGTTLSATLIPEATSSGVGWQTKWNPATIVGTALADNQATLRRWDVVEAGVLSVDLSLTWLDGAAGKQGVGVRDVSFVRYDSAGAYIEELEDSKAATPGADTVGVVNGSLSVNAGDRLAVLVFHNAGGNITVSPGSIALTLTP